MFRIKYYLTCDSCGRVSQQSSFLKSKVLQSCKDRDWVSDVIVIGINLIERHYCPSCKKSKFVKLNNNKG